MNENDRNAVLITGLAGILSAVVMGISDFIIGALPISSREALNLGLDSFIQISQSRLTVGAVMGVMCIPFHIIGLLQIYIGVRPAGRLWSIPTTFFMFYAMVIGAVFHGTIGFIAIAKKTFHAAGEGHVASLSGMMDTFIHHNNIYLYVLLVCLIIGSIWFAAAVATGRTLYPRWMCLFNPLLIYIVVLVVFRNLPAPIGGYMINVNFNVTILIFLTMSTVRLLRGERSSA